jgi:autotransporter-associated beta strand protein
MRQPPLRRKTLSRRVVKCVALAGGLATPAFAQTTITGSSLALHSSGANSSNSWTLSSDGYVGTYINLTQPAPVTFTLNASGTASNGLSPDMMISIADSTQSFNVTSSSLSNYTYTTPTLAAGTYFVRTQLDNQTATQSPSLTVGSMTVSGTGVSVLNTSNAANALASATTYATNYRSGAGSLTLTNANGIHLGAGTQVVLKLSSNAFNFAGAVYGQSPFSSPSNWMNWNSSGQNLTPNTPEEMNYQNAILSNFNMIVPSNAGKWQNNEFTQNSVNVSMLDAMQQFASQHGLRMRGHNLIWDNQQPAFINSLFNVSNGAVASPSTLTSDINSRINYYVSGVNPNSLNQPRTDSYAEMDVLNEPFHGLAKLSSTQSFYDDYLGSGALGVSGVASIYTTVHNAVVAAGANTRLTTNEFNVMQFSPQTVTASGSSGSDAYANWYLNGVQSLQRAGAPIGEIGMETYITANNNLDAGTMMQAMQNMSVAKDPSGNPMPLALTEFGLASGAPSASNYSTDLTTALTMMYGDPQATTFGFWGGIGGPGNSNGIYALYDSSYNLTSTGSAWQSWMNQWNTNVTLTTDANGNVSFNGTYGLYTVTIGGQNYTLNLTKGTTSYGLMSPIATSTWGGAGGTSNWSTSGNWQNGPLAANAPLVFAGSTGLSSNNDSTANTEYAGITFNASAGGFTLTGNAVNLAGGIVNNSSNLQTINIPLALQANTTVNSASGDVAIGGAMSGSFSLSKSGSHNLTLNSPNSYTGGTSVSAGTLIANAPGALPNGPVTISGGTLQLGPSVGSTTINNLSITGSGTFDLNNNHIFINYNGAADPISSVVALLQTGFAGGTWTGPGIDSSAAAANAGSYGLGYADSADSGNPAGLSNNTIEIAYTLLGDANLDGVVNGVDFGILAANFNRGVSRWDQGDFNYDGAANGVDFGDLAANFNRGASGAADFAALESFAAANGLLADVPEPATVAISILASTALLARRRRVS